MPPPRVCVAALLVACLWSTLAIADDPTPGLKVGAASVAIEADDAMIIGGGIGGGTVAGEEAPLRATALVIDDGRGGKAAIVACDVLMVERDVLDRAAREIAAKTGVPFDAVMIHATHTHHAPTTASIHGYRRDEVFTARVEAAAVAAAERASGLLGPAALFYRRGEESTVGRNSRLLLADGTIYWVGPRDDAVRPTGPFDPALPVLAFRRPNGTLAGAIFNHSTHTIGTREPGKRSPGFYGLAAQDLEREHGAPFLFLSGASGSTHNLDLKGDEMARRIGAAVEQAMEKADKRPVDRIRARRAEITWRVRTFDEAAEEAAVSSYCRKRIGDAKAAERTIGIFREMRRELAPRQGHERKTWVQVVTIGDVAIVGTPGEFFTALGLAIKAGSPFRETLVVQLANDYVGYLPDREAFDLGGYQTWTGLHSYLEKGSGERVVDEALTILRDLKAGQGDE